jgi:hypothetical protein
MLVGCACGAIAIGLRLLAEQTASVPSAAAPEANSPPAAVAEASSPETPAPEKAEKKPERRAPVRVIRLDEVKRDEQPFVDPDPKPASGWPFVIAGAGLVAVGGVLLFPCVMDANDHSSTEDRDDCGDAPRILGLTALLVSAPFFLIGFAKNSQRKAWKRRQQPPRVVPLVTREALFLSYQGTF